MRRILGVAVAFCFVFFGLSDITAQDNLMNGKTPRIVIGITIDDMRVEYLDKFYNTFEKGGFKRLMNGGVCKNAFLDIHNINDATGSATISTGTFPSDHGIVGRQWFKQLTSEVVQSVQDDYYMTVGSDSEMGECSAKNLKMLTLGDQLKITSNNKSKVFSVAVNPEVAVLSAGHIADGAYWFDESNGNMISSSYYISNFPDWVSEFNTKKLTSVYIDRDWELLLPESSYNLGLVDGYVLEKGYWSRWNTFPYNLSKLKSNTEFDFSILKATPFINSYIKDFSVHLIENELLGRDNNPDILNIGFSSLDFAGKWFEPTSVEIHDLYLRIDRCISGLLKYLDDQFGRDNYLVYLTAPTTKEFSVNVLKDDYKFPAGGFSPASSMALLRAYLNITFGTGDWIEMYNEEQIYLNHTLIEREQVDLEEIQKKVALFMNQFEGVKAAIPASVIETSNLDNARFKIAENSYCIQRSGDVVILLDQGWQPEYKYHEVDYTSLQRVPIMFYGSFIKPAVVYDNVSVVDIVPTLAAILNVTPPDKARGTTITGVLWK